MDISELDSQLKSFIEKLKKPAGEKPPQKAASGVHIQIPVEPMEESGISVKEWKKKSDEDYAVFKSKFTALFSLFLQEMKDEGVAVPDILVMEKNEDGVWHTGVLVKSFALTQWMKLVGALMPKGMDVQEFLDEILEAYQQSKENKLISFLPVGTLQELKQAAACPSDLPLEAYADWVHTVLLNGMGDKSKLTMKGHNVKYYTITGAGHHLFKYAKGVLMHFKVSWKGDPDRRLCLWALGNKEQAMKVTVWTKGGHNELWFVAVDIAYQAGYLVKGG